MRLSGRADGSLRGRKFKPFFAWALKFKGVLPAFKFNAACMDLAEFTSRKAWFDGLNLSKLARIESVKFLSKAYMLCLNLVNLRGAIAKFGELNLAAADFGKLNLSNLARSILAKFKHALNLALGKLIQRVLYLNLALIKLNSASKFIAKFSYLVGLDKLNLAFQQVSLPIFARYKNLSRSYSRALLVCQILLQSSPLSFTNRRALNLVEAQRD